MTFKPTEVVKVKYCRGDEIINMGRFAIENRKIFFQNKLIYQELYSNFKYH